MLAQELVEDRISVSELVPGPVDSRDRDPEELARGSVIAANPSEWVKRPEDVVPLAVFLASQPLIGPMAQRFSLMGQDG